MKQPVLRGKRSGSLRQQARQLLRASRSEILAMPDRKVRALIHELRAHQIELELQNEALRQAQVELAESRDRYADLYESSPIGYVTLDQEGRILETNLAAAALLGVNRVDLAGEEIYHFVVQECRDKCCIHLQAAFDTHTKQICELNMRKTDGSRLSVCLQSLTQQSPSATGHCRTALIDVTDARLAQDKLEKLREELENLVQIRTADLQKRTNQLLEQSAHLDRRERHFRTLANNVPAMFSYTDRDQRYRYVNHQYVKFWQRPASEIVGKTMAEFLGPAVFDKIRPHIEAVLGGGESAYKVDIDHPDGRRVMQARHMPDRDKLGNICGFFTIIIDITELQQVEQALREREERMRAVLNTATDGIITFDQRGMIVDTNPAVLRMFGYSNQKLVGRNMKVLIPRLTATNVKNLTSQASDTSMRSFRSEETGVRKDGSTFPLDLALSKMEHLGLYTGIVRDITDRKEIESDLEQYRKNLQTMSSELMIIEERERQRLANDLHDSLGQAVFQARMKLDRAPLTERTITEIRAIFDEIKAKVNALTYELSPLVLRQMGLGPALEWLIGNLKQRYALRVRLKGGSSDISLDERVALVLFWSVREVLINIAKHAQTDFATAAVQESNHHVKVVVKDLGTGFDPDDPTYHVRNGHFGLFSVRERLEYIGGSIKIRSAPGKGTTVTLTVPRKTIAYRVPQDLKASDSAKPANGLNRGNGRTAQKSGAHAAPKK